MIIDGALKAFAPAGLDAYTIPNTVSSIGDWTFYDTELKSVTIPISVTSIGDEAFHYSTSLEEIVSLSNTPPNLGKNVFSNIASDYTIKVPNISVSTYKGASNWSTYGNNISELNRSECVAVLKEGLATLWLEYDAEIPNDAEMYYVSAYNSETNKVSITKIDGNVVPRETGVIVKGRPLKTYSINEIGIEGTKLEEGNLLVGSATEKTYNDVNYKYYSLTYSNNDDDFGFHLENDEGTIENSIPHKAYLELPTSTSAPIGGIGIYWGIGVTTEIESIVERDTDGGTRYNLQGMPVSKGYKGIVVNRSRKILMK